MQSSSPFFPFWIHAPESVSKRERERHDSQRMDSALLSYSFGGAARPSCPLAESRDPVFPPRRGILSLSLYHSLLRWSLAPPPPEAKEKDSSSSSSSSSPLWQLMIVRRSLVGLSLSLSPNFPFLASEADEEEEKGERGRERSRGVVLSIELGPKKSTNAFKLG